MIFYTFKILEIQSKKQVFTLGTIMHAGKLNFTNPGFFWEGALRRKILQFSSFTSVHLQRTQLIVYQTVWHLFDMETDFTLQLNLIEDGSEWW